MYLPGTDFELETIADALWYLPLYSALKKEKGVDFKISDVTNLKPPHSYTKVRNLGSDTIERCPIFALTIGINNYCYAGVKGLRGCVADADDFCDFLTKVLHVPTENITNLRDEQATATEIIKAFEALVVDSRIPKGSPILIFYAGHGVEALAPEGWISNDGVIQSLVPYNFFPGTEWNRTTKNSISDIKLGQLLEKIANAKGNNITVIFDCCHSGSGTRGKLETEGLDRNIEVPLGTRLGRDALPAPGLTFPATLKNKYKGTSHVLLAACTEQQTAREYGGRGVFASALISLLRSAVIHNLTYRDVIRMLPALPSQNPQLEGLNQNCILFHNVTPSAKRIYYNLTIANPQNGTYRIDAGEAHGITINAEFFIYADDATKNPNPVALEGVRLIVETTSTFSSTLHLADGSRTFTGGAFALQVKKGNPHDVCLFVDFIDDLHGVFQALGQQMQSKETGKPSYKLVPTRDKNPDLIITSDRGVARFEITDKICRDRGLSKIPCCSGADSETMSRILPGIADFHWNLHRANPNLNGKIKNMIEFECMELASTKLDDNHDEVFRPVGKNLFTGTSIDLNVRIQAPKPYGFSIRSKTNVPLFVSVFYFDMSDFSIESYYEPPFARADGHVPSIRPNGCLTIGYGSGGFPPRSFSLSNDQGITVGYIKLFFSTEYVDYSAVPQMSPFNERATNTFKHRPTALWDTMLVPVIQHRYGINDAELGLGVVSWGPMSSRSNNEETPGILITGLFSDFRRFANILSSDSEKHGLPSNVLKGGWTGLVKAPIFLGRAEYKGGLYPGYIKDACLRIAYNRKVMTFNKYEVLTGPSQSVHWVAVSGAFHFEALCGVVPVRGGMDENGEPFYIAQITYIDTLYQKLCLPGLVQVGGHASVPDLNSMSSVESESYNVLVFA
ncbi:hypothetical protein BT96DRAFT_878516 [Gymnopus androsaceus JB14]|uniref:Peptidase C14 caspase domain-containing protein n=1 Tax=Gymnopus androsaceus JB14 TaxID=1447944 RepID=A0A6A4HZL3_9AGAR|nr:hypothetical protein BT96DRAFT_878516 [Gymnopus androsaceus JB14]